MFPEIEFAQRSRVPSRRWVFVLYGGAGMMQAGDREPKREAAIRASPESALQAGSDILDRDGSALDAVEKATVLMEDDPLFNAGRGAVLTAEGEIELDASIMDGASPRAGAVREPDCRIGGSARLRSRCRQPSI
jgi:L-asparaginase / beta-aspartyl-peptidase